MGEQPIFTSKAHVFQIDPTTKKNWLPSSNGAVNVSFYYDTNRNTYRVISVDGSKAIINSTLVSNMVFTKTSQKFGQWSDARANTVYGLGFGTEAELNKFYDKFMETRQLTKPQDNTTIPIPTDHGHQSGDSQQNGDVLSYSSAKIERLSPMLSRTDNGCTADSNQQLKHENECLKIALSQSSQNAQKWETEIQTLKNNNARLTAALQESTSNVDEWKRQLATYKEENTRLKKMLSELEQQQPNHQQELLARQRETSEALTKLSLCENDKKSCVQDIEQLRAKIDHLATVEEVNKKLERELKDCRTQNGELVSKLAVVLDELDTQRASQSHHKAELAILHEKISQNVAELVTAQNTLAHLLNSP